MSPCGSFRRWRNKSSSKSGFIFGRDQTAYYLPKTVMLTDDPNPFQGYAWHMIEGTKTTSMKTGVNQDYRGQHEQIIKEYIAKASGGISTPFVGLNMNGAAFVAAWEMYNRNNREVVMRDFLVSNVTTEASASVNIAERRHRLGHMLKNDIIEATPEYITLGTSTVGGFGDMHLYKWGDEQDNFKHLRLLHQLTIKNVPDVLMTPSTLRNTIIYEMDENQTVTLKHPLNNVSCAAKIVTLQCSRIDGSRDTVYIQRVPNVPISWEVIFPNDIGTQVRQRQALSLFFISTAPELLALSQFGSIEISSLELSVRSLANMSCYPTARDEKIATYSGHACHVCDSVKRAPGLRRAYVTYSPRMLAAAKHIVID